MQHLPQIDLARRALRGTICPECYQRPPHSESLGPAIARSCEPQCALFRYVDRLMVIAKASAAGEADDFESAIRDDVCNKCCTAPTAGDYCSERLNATCTLSRFAGQAVAVLQALVEAETHAAQPLPAGRSIQVDLGIHI